MILFLGETFYIIFLKCKVPKLSPVARMDLTNSLTSFDVREIEAGTIRIIEIVN
ncbi:MAG: hypothetical protein ACI8YP_003227 [Algoriphagus sp.]|jgi:hypothetical protein